MLRASDLKAIARAGKSVTRPARMLRASGSRAAVLRRIEQARFSPASDDEVGGFTSAMREQQSSDKKRNEKHQ